MKRVFSALFALLLTLSALSACGSAGTAPAANAADGQTEAAAETTTEEEVKVPTNSEIVKERYDGSDFGGYAVRVASISPGEFPYRTSDDFNEVLYEKETGDVLNDSYYRRNAMTEDALNVVITPVWCGDGGKTQTAIQKSVLAGNDDYDLTVCRFDYQMNLASQRLYYDLRTLSPMDVEDPWWNALMVKNATLYGKLTTIAGDLNTQDDYGVDLMLYNQRLAAAYALPDLYQAARDGQWTLEMMNTCAETAVSDLNGDGVMKVEDDQFGVANNSSMCIHLIFSFGEKITQHTEDGGLTINYSEHLVNVTEDIYNFVAVSGNMLLDPNTFTTFQDNRVLFQMECTSVLPRLRAMEDDFGILPCPKYNEEQDDYTAYVSNGTSTSISIPVTVTDVARSAAVLDTLGGYGTETVRASFDEYMMRAKFVRDEESVEMLDNYVIGHGVYDLAGDLSWSSNLRDIYNNLATAKSNNFVSTFESKKDACQGKLDAFLAAFAD